jgi:hypothetical protein
MNVLIPWTTYGCLAPFLGHHPTNSDAMSPFHVPAEAFVRAFGWSEHRRKLLRGFLRYRKAIWDQGHRDVVQWVGGSFVEQVENIREGNAPPQDIDVVNLMVRPEWWSREAHESLFLPDQTKKHFHVDAYVIETNAEPGEVVRDVTFWHAFFGHQRSTFAWKGMLAIRIDPEGDEAASKALDAMEKGLRDS